MKFPYYPILYSLSPILLILASNTSNLPAKQIFPIILISPIIAGFIIWIINKWVKNIHHSALIAFLISIWFYHYGTVRLWAVNIIFGSTSLGSHWIFFPLWLIIFIFLASGWLWHKITKPEVITIYLNILCIFTIAVSLYRIALDFVPRYTYHPDLEKFDKTVNANKLTSELPDVYYIILDGYARRDILDQIYKYNNSDFLIALEKRGFYIASESQSNYIQTALSLSSSMNMEYLDDLSKLDPDRGQLIGMIQNSKIQALFKGMGYRFISFPTGYLPTDITNSDIYLNSSSLNRQNTLEALLIVNSVLKVVVDNNLLGIPITHFSTAQNRINFLLSALANEVSTINGPKFVFAHIIAPHPPFVFNQNGPVTPTEIYMLGDGDAYPDGASAYIPKYVDQLQYINEQVLFAIDSILSKSSIPPIIILQADHGPGAYLNWSSADKSCLQERFSILNAIYLPNSGLEQQIPDLSPVNIFPYVLNSYFGAHLPILENYRYYSTWEKPYNFIDVTDQTQQKCNLP